MEYGFEQISIDFTTFVFLVLLLIPELICIFLNIKTKNKYYFIASAIINVLTMVLIVTIAPLIHANDHCEALYTHGPGIDIALYSSGVPCMQAPDLFFPMFLGISLGVFVIGLIMAIKNRRRKHAK